MKFLAISLYVNCQIFNKTLDIGTITNHLSFTSVHDFQKNVSMSFSGVIAGHKSGRVLQKITSTSSTKIGLFLPLIIRSISIVNVNVW